MLGLLFCNFGFHLLVIFVSLIVEFLKKCKRKGIKIIQVKTAGEACFNSRNDVREAQIEAFPQIL